MPSTPNCAPSPVRLGRQRIRKPEVFCIQSAERICAPGATSPVRAGPKSRGTVPGRHVVDLAVGKDARHANATCLKAAHTEAMTAALISQDPVTPMRLAQETHLPTGDYDPR